MLANYLFQENQNNENQTTQNLENWLPITASRKAKWWYSTFHNVTAMVGAGILGLPYAVSQLTWYVNTSHIKYFSIWSFIKVSFQFIPLQMQYS